MKIRIKLVTLLFILGLLIAFTTTAFAQGDNKKEGLEVQATEKETLDRLFANSYEVFRDLRNDLGVYRDSILLEPGENYHPSSVASTGVGLMSLTIADKKNWEEGGLEKAKQTVATMTDQLVGFSADRTANGFYRHFINMETGAQEWNSEYSTIDTAIFLAGALFAEKYFNDAELSEAVAKLYHSIDFEAALADSDTGGIYLTMNQDGTGVSNSITLPYNEYIIVAWFAYNQNRGNPESKAVKLWKKHYETPKNLLTKPFHDINLLTDNSDHYLSSFTFLFPYYMVNMFSKSDEYKPYIENAYQADKLWSELTNKTNPYEWGNGAGASSEGYGYHADAINNNQPIIISPHIISGFLPVNPSGSQDLLDLYANKKGIYQLQSDKSKEILWRYSIEDPTWKANSIQGIDYSTFLFGLATLDTDLGLNFFQENNNFFTNVAFDLNGGTSVTPPAQNLAVRDILKEPTPKPTRPGYTFIGWNTSLDGSGATWDFTTTEMPSNDLTLYAQWQANTRTIYFDLNGGTSVIPPAQNVAVGAPVMEPTPTPIRPGYTFTGWNSSITGSGIVWDFSTNRMPDNDLLLYAQWQINTYTVIFDSNGGTSAEYPPQSIVFGAILKEPNPAPTRQGYTFVGWYDETNNLWAFGKMTMPDMELKLVAHWEKLSSNSIESDGGGISKTENKPSAENSIFPKTGEKSSLMTTLGLLLIGCLAIGLYPRKYKI